MGRPNPRAPYVALDVMAKGAGAAAARGQSSSSATPSSTSPRRPRARPACASSSPSRRCRSCRRTSPARRATLKRIGIDGVDGYMGNAIALARARGRLRGRRPRAAAAVRRRRCRRSCGAKYGRAVKKGAMSAGRRRREGRRACKVDDRHRRISSTATSSSRRAWRTARSRREFYRALGKGMKADGLVASNSSSMGPGLLGAVLRRGRRRRPTQPAQPALLQPGRASDDAAGRGHRAARTRAATRSPPRTPSCAGSTRRRSILQDGSPGFLVNAGLAAYMLEAETIYREGTPVEAIDEAMREAIFPMGPFELGDQAGLDIAAGMFDTIAAAETPLDPQPLVWKLREPKRFGIKTGAGVYDYKDGKKTGEWPGLAALVPDRGTPRRVDGRDRRALRQGALHARRASSATARSSPPRRSAISRSSSASASRCTSAGRSSTASSAAGSRFTTEEHRGHEPSVASVVRFATAAAGRSRVRPPDRRP